jgi:5-formyltetrahydrofolate cyclo-ligase
MEIISLLPFFIFLLFVFLTIYRTKQRLKNLAKSKNIRLKPEESGKEKKSGWKNILIEAYEQIQREIKAAQEKKQAKYGTSEKAPDQSQSSTLLWEKEALIPSPPPIPSKDIKKKKTATPSRKSELVKVQEPKIVKPDLPLIQKPTVQDLRKAIVWSEILAPPVALRENQDIF